MGTFTTVFCLWWIILFNWWHVTGDSVLAQMMVSQCAAAEMNVEGEAVLGHYASIAGTGTEYDTEVDREVVDTFIR